MRVRIPPGPLNQHAFTPSRSSPECSPRCQRGDQGFKSPRGRLRMRTGTVRQPAERPGSNPGDCGFESLSCHRNLYRLRRLSMWQAQVAVTHPPPGFAGSTPARRTGSLGCSLLALSSMRKDATPSRWRRGFDSRRGFLLILGHPRRVAEREDARVSDARARLWAWEFESPLGDYCGWAGARPRLITSAFWVRLPDPRLVSLIPSRRVGKQAKPPV